MVAESRVPFALAATSVGSGQEEKNESEGSPRNSVRINHLSSFNTNELASGSALPNPSRREKGYQGVFLVVKRRVQNDFMRELFLRLESNLFRQMPTHEPLAIVGMACRFPGGANDPSSFWELLRNGVDAITEVPEERWNVSRFHHTNAGAPGRSLAIEMPPNSLTRVHHR